MSLETVIQRCKDEIEHRARWMNLGFDREDIEHLTFPDGHTVVLLKLYYGAIPLFDDSDDMTTPEGEYTTGKIPNVWLSSPDPKENSFPPMAPWNLRIHAWLPKVRVQFSQLVYIILPDGTVKKSDSPEVIERRRKMEMRKVTADMDLPGLAKLVKGLDTEGE